MHIAHIMTRLLRAGSEENILLTSAGQISDGHDVTLIYGSQSNPSLADKIVPRARRIEIPALVRPIRPIKDIFAYRQLKRVLQTIRPDVVHTHQSKAGLVGRFAAAAAEVPLVVHGVHILPFVGVGPLARTVFLMAERVAAPITHGYIHVSEGMLDACREHAIGKGCLHSVVYSGFDLDRFRRANWPQDWRALLGVGEANQKPFVIAMLAALEARKRHLELLEALGGLLAAEENIRLVFAGEGPLREAILRKAKSLGIAERVRTVGYREDPERIIALSDICVLSSGQEGLPRSVLQYVSAAKPVVLFDLPGVNVVVQDKFNGFVIEKDNWDEFREAVQNLMNDAELRSQFHRNAASIEMSPWDWREMGSLTTRFYREVQLMTQLRKPDE